ncbi:hypothetical protein N7539_002573 [Penicillium diatomitis]|uniref:Uncharacterized protein n=1 Tax=Penicillium diatomitis TaxID=2819901 RepID=A0A9X0BYT9_9EURO|nr:uncharacterized protein N7539_002573 [Penicillium diatomitis]KAJ5491006.1 hypothetical protein N7539_002573 [Penicillium diatomitis]
MHITFILQLSILGLASLTLAMPRASKPSQVKPLSSRMIIDTPASMNTPTPSASYSSIPLASQIATMSPATQGNLVTAESELPNHVKHVNHCLELCSLEAQTCNIAVPNDDQFCRDTYAGCMERCHPDDFQ